MIPVEGQLPHLFRLWDRQLEELSEAEHFSDLVGIPEERTSM